MRGRGGFDDSRGRGSYQQSWRGGGEDQGAAGGFPVQRKSGGWQRSASSGGALLPHPSILGAVPVRISTNPMLSLILQGRTGKSRLPRVWGRVVLRRAVLCLAVLRLVVADFPQEVSYWRRETQKVETDRVRVHLNRVSPSSLSSPSCSLSPPGQVSIFSRQQGEGREKTRVGDANLTLLHIPPRRDLACDPGLLTLGCVRRLLSGPRRGRARERWWGIGRSARGLWCL